MRTKSVYLYIALAVILGGLTACKTKNINRQSADILIHSEGMYTIDDLSKKTPSKDSLAIEKLAEARDSIIFSPAANNKVYRIAVILPFMEDSVRKVWNKSSKKNYEKFVTSKESEMSISFMEGMLMAFQDTSFQSKFEFQFFDDKHSNEAMSSVLRAIQNDSFDILIGPALKVNISRLSKYAEENQIIHISPFSPSQSASQGNPKYYMAEPPLIQHIRTILQYGIDSIQDVNLKFFYHSNHSGKEYANSVAKYLDDYNDRLSLEDKIKYSNIALKNDDFIESFSLDQYIEESEHNLLIVNSFNENFIHHFLSQAAPFQEDTNLTIFGMPGWEEIETIRLEYINGSKIHFTQSYWMDDDNKHIVNFIAKYQDKYFGKPSKYVFLGYEIATIFFPFIDEYGLNFNSHLLQLDFQPKARRYNFKEVLDAEGQVKRIENTSLRIYKIADFEQVLVK